MIFTTATASLSTAQALGNLTGDARAMFLMVILVGGLPDHAQAWVRG